MKSSHLRSDSFSTALWSGGTTTQLFIYPEHAHFKNHDFDFRISVATVTAEETIFTELPGVERKLMVLSGKITLLHERQVTKELHKFDVDHFQGQQKTRSIGKCTDFNLMTRGTFTSNLRGCEINKGAKGTYTIDEPLDWLFMYVHVGEITIPIPEAPQRICQGELFILRELNAKIIDFVGIEHSELIFVEIAGKAT